MVNKSWDFRKLQENQLKHQGFVFLELRFNINYVMLCYRHRNLPHIGLAGYCRERREEPSLASHSGVIALATVLYFRNCFSNCSTIEFRSQVIQKNQSYLNRYT
jgi:hypothetical protein